jgi:hypothetical protein
MNRDIVLAAEVLSKNTLAFVASPQVGDDVFAPLEEEGGMMLRFWRTPSSLLARMDSC